MLETNLKHTMFKHRLTLNDLIEKENKKNINKHEKSKKTGKQHEQITSNNINDNETGKTEHRNEKRLRVLFSGFPGVLCFPLCFFCIFLQLKTKH